MYYCEHYGLSLFCYLFAIYVTYFEGSPSGEAAKIGII
jgi:hypothetical protein